MKKYSNGRAMSGLFVFALLGVFAVMCTLLVLLGAQAYRGVVDGASENAEMRLMISYPTNLVRMNDNASNLSVQSRGGVDALVITQQFDDEAYETLVYCYEGMLYELFKAQDDELSLDYGEPITKAQFFRPSIKDGLFSFEIGGEDGETYSARVALRSRAAQGEVQS